jgi:hypothetical protein
MARYAALIALAVAVAGMVAGCDSERVELFPDAAPTVDLLSPDLRSTCVCRAMPCRTSVDCAKVGAGSVCDSSFVCTGAIGTCSTVQDCAADPSGWVCVTSATSLTTCGQ